MSGERALRSQLLREHLEREDDPAGDAGLLDPDDAAAAVRASAAALDGWHAGGRTGPRPPGRLRAHRVERSPTGRLTAAAYRVVLDPDGRPLDMRLRRTC